MRNILLPVKKEGPIRYLAQGQLSAAVHDSTIIEHDGYRISGMLYRCRVKYNFLLVGNYYQGVHNFQCLMLHFYVIDNMLIDSGVLTAVKEAISLLLPFSCQKRFGESADFVCKKKWCAYVVGFF